jgi:hypothetical protein
VSLQHPGGEIQPPGNALSYRMGREHYPRGCDSPLSIGFHQQPIRTADLQPAT